MLEVYIQLRLPVFPYLPPFSLHPSADECWNPKLHCTLTLSHYPYHAEIQIVAPASLGHPLLYSLWTNYNMYKLE